MKLDCYALLPDPPRIEAAPINRDWMDGFPSRHAYRCLPLNIANSYGWNVLAPCTFGIDWNGGPTAADITFVKMDEYPYLDHFVASNFTHGIVTFHTGYLFRTQPDWSLVATGPLNQPKDGITPLTGIIETGWLPYPFTMNWQLTRPGSVVFEKGEAFCTVIPIVQAQLDSIEPTIRDIGDDPDLERQYIAWRDRRESFMAQYRAGDAETLKQAWQRFYFAGKLPDGTPTTAEHRTKVKLADPVDRRRRGR